MKEERVQRAETQQIRIVYADRDAKRMMNLAEFKRADKALAENYQAHHEIHLALKQLRQQDTEYAAWYFEFMQNRQRTLELFRKSKSLTWSHFKRNYEAMKQGKRPQFNNHNSNR